MRRDLLSLRPVARQHAEFIIAARASAVFIFTVQKKKRKTSETLLNTDGTMSDNEFDDDDLAMANRKIETKRIFINHVDTFTGKNLAMVTYRIPNLKKYILK